MAQRAEEFEVTLGGITYYGACGARDVLIVSSSECSQDPNSAPRQNGGVDPGGHGQTSQ